MLYRGKYLIGVYGPVSEGETLLALCDNRGEFAEFLNISKNDATVILCKLFNGDTSYIIIDGKICSVAFIEY